MKQKREKKSKRITLKSLAAHLRRLPEVEIPETLKPRLLAAIPDMQQKHAPAHQFRWYHAGDLGVTAAAVVFIFVLIFLINYSLYTPSRTEIIEFDTSLCYTSLYQNGFMYDQNNTYLEKYVPYQLK